MASARGAPDSVLGCLRRDVPCRKPRLRSNCSSSTQTHELPITTARTFSYARRKPASSRRTLPHFRHFSRQEAREPRRSGRWSWPRQNQSQARLHPQHFQQRKGLSERTSPEQQKRVTLICPSSAELPPSIHAASLPPSKLKQLKDAHMTAMAHLHKLGLKFLPITCMRVHSSPPSKCEKLPQHIQTPA